MTLVMAGENRHQVLEEAAMQLLSKPDQEEEATFSKTLRRGSCSYEDRCERFRLKERRYTQQYASLYFMRLNKMREMVKASAISKWGPDCRIIQLGDLHDNKGQKCCIIGTLFKKMELQPSILKEISTKYQLVPQPPPRVKYVGVNDQLIIEDQVQRVVLCGNISHSHYVTGIVIGLYGRELRNGSFVVEDVCFPEMPEQEEIVAMETDEEDKYVVLVSGLNIGSAWYDQLSIQTFVDYVTGQLGGPHDQKFCSSIVRLIVAGNSTTDQPVKTTSGKENKVRFQAKNYSAQTIEAVKELDDVLVQLASSVPVDLMPGLHDPTNHQLPQQPLHRCMFPQTGQLQTLRGVTNPYAAAINGVSFLGTSGEAVEDIFKFSTMSNRLTIIENTLKWRHMAPTAPDTLGSYCNLELMPVHDDKHGCYPFYDEDPFIIGECPHVYFAGNQPTFQHTKIHGDKGQTVLILSLPNFDLTHSCVIVNLRTLDCEEVKFSTSMEQKPNPELERVRKMTAELEAAESEKNLLSQPEGEEDMSILRHMDMDDDDDD